MNKQIQISSVQIQEVKERTFNKINTSAEF